MRPSPSHFLTKFWAKHKLFLLFIFILFFTILLVRYSRLIFIISFHLILILLTNNFNSGLTFLAPDKDNKKDHHAKLKCQLCYTIILIQLDQLYKLKTIWNKIIRTRRSTWKSLRHSKCCIIHNRLSSPPSEGKVGYFNINIPAIYDNITIPLTWLLWRGYQWKVEF